MAKRHKSGGALDTKVSFASMAEESMQRIESANVVFKVLQDEEFSKEIGQPLLFSPFEIRTNAHLTFDKLKDIIYKIAQKSNPNKAQNTRIVNLFIQNDHGIKKLMDEESPL